MSSIPSYPDPNSIKVINNTDGNVISYQCEYLLAYNNTFPQQVVPAYYNLAYPCNGNDNNTSSEGFSVQDMIAQIEEKLLVNAALTWSIHPNTSGKGCSDPSLEAYNTIQVAVSSMPKDEIASSLTCRTVPSLSSGTEPTCCSVVQSQMTFTPQGSFESLNLVKFVADQFDSGSLTDGESFATSYAGSFAPPLNQASDTIDGTGRNTAPTPQQPMASAISNGETVQKNDKKFTPIGGVVLGGLVATFIVFVVVLVRRRRRQWYIDEPEIYDMKDEHDIEGNDANVRKTVVSSHMDNGGFGDSGGVARQTRAAQYGETFEVSVLSDDLDVYTTNGDGSFRSSLHNRQHPSSPTQSPFKVSSITMPTTGYATPTNDKNFLHDAKIPSYDMQATVSKSDSYDGTNDMDSIDSSNVGNNPRYRQTGFAFDLGQSFKNEVMRKHSTASHRNFAANSANAPTMIEVVPPYPMMEETSDSEVDSWAQTDGTVGSLEERLEDITAEI